MVKRFGAVFKRFSFRESLVSDSVEGSVAAIQLCVAAVMGLT